MKRGYYKPKKEHIEKLIVYLKKKKDELGKRNDRK